MVRVQLKGLYAMFNVIIRTIGIVFIMFSCCLCGYATKYKYNMRIHELENFLLCIDMLQKEITLKSSTIYNSLLKLLDYADEYNINFFLKVMEIQRDSDGESISEIWNTAITEATSTTAIYNNNDINIIKGIGGALGCVDITVQKENLDAIKTLLSEAIQSSKVNKDKIHISSKIGVYVGIIVSILLF